MQAPSHIDLPPPPSDPVTPSDVPGTPNSTTTSLSELSTVAIKDGHRGHLPHHHTHHPTSGLNTQLDAERADRISRLAGLTHVTTARNPQLAGIGGSAAYSSPNPYPQSGASYFDASGNPAMRKEISTVGSASATGSVGARTTWAGSEAGDTFDKMSESQDMDTDHMDTASVGAQSEEAASLVGFGEGARTPARGSTIGSPAVSKGLIPSGREPRSTMDGIAAYDPDFLDPRSRPTTGTSTTAIASPSSVYAEQQAERTLRENMNTTSADRMSSMRRQQGSRDPGQF